MIYIYLAVCVVGFVTLGGDFSQMYLLYMISVIGIMISRARNTTILHLCAGLLLVKIIELAAIFYFPTQADINTNIAPVWLNTNNYLIHLVLDVCLLWFIMFRPYISRHYLRWLAFPFGKQHTDGELTYTQTEAWLITVMFMYFAVDLAALAENLIRNLEHVGVDESIAAYFWKWTLVYHAYLPVKNYLNLLELVVIWFSVSPRGEQPINKKLKQGLHFVFRA